jgi:hypothetical protein
VGGTSVGALSSHAGNKAKDQQQINLYSLLKIIKELKNVKKRENS